MYRIILTNEEVQDIRNFDKDIDSSEQAHSRLGFLMGRAVQIDDATAVNGSGHTAPPALNTGENN